MTALHHGESRPRRPAFGRSAAHTDPGGQGHPRDRQCYDSGENALVERLNASCYILFAKLGHEPHSGAYRITRFELIPRNNVRARARFAACARDIIYIGSPA